MNALEDTNPGDFTTVSDDDTLPVILGKRHAIRGYSGDVPTLGAIPGADGRPLTMKANVPPLPPGNETPRLAPLIRIASTCMEVRKTGMVRQLVRQLTAKGLRVAACKVTGSASPRDKPKLRRESADPVYAVHDGGIPSTCGDVNGVITSALRVLVAASQSDPDVIVVEFGDGIIAWGAKEPLGRIGMDVPVFTAVGVNSESAQRLIEKEMGVLAESNRSDLPRTLELIKSKLDEALEALEAPEVLGIMAQDPRDLLESMVPLDIRALLVLSAIPVLMALVLTVALRGDLTEVLLVVLLVALDTMGLPAALMMALPAVLLAVLVIMDLPAA
ncbi:hypothetical protein N8T08_007938 [Aspergillus melleus]|uniref:Uncharacterized protein n=1 Tax=Aspergillus melleus TaxID=138277 RepID=A0ACC3AY03_9EURO|nr:hypothetical protein N8T08_007938 [Aspergillus melleus]